MRFFLFMMIIMVSYGWELGQALLGLIQVQKNSLCIRRLIMDSFK